MKKYLKMSYSKKTLEALLIAIYILGFYLNINLLVWALGLYLLFWFFPKTILSLFNFELSDLIEKIFFNLTLYFFFLTPTLFFLNKFFSVPLSWETISLILLMPTVFYFFKPSKNKSNFNRISQKGILKYILGYRLLIMGTFLFLLTHWVNFHFYKFIPEWDGYSDLIKIDEIVDSGIIQNTYRGFFATSVAIWEIFTKINSYQIFSFWLIIFQATLIFSIWKFIQIYSLKNKFLQLLPFFGALSIPVLNMEIDMVRPQNILIIFFPIYIYFLFQALRNNSTYYWILSSLIAFFGLNYHEFFTFIFVFQVIWISFNFFKKLSPHLIDKKTRPIFVFSLFSILLVGLDLFSRVPQLKIITGVGQSIIRGLLNVSQWRWWFLGSYNNDGVDLQMGWPGFVGALKYYSYYLAPFCFLIFILLIFLLIRKRNLFKTNLLLKISIPFLVTFFLFAEIFPRLNYLYLPERFYLLIDLILILVLIPLLNIIEKTSLKRNLFSFFLIVFFIFSWLGIGGSFYVAKNKGSLTSVNEYQAALWMKNNTPKNSVFISQTANGPMIKYFAKRNNFTPNEEYFLSPQIIDTIGQIKSLEDKQSVILEHLQKNAKDFTKDRITLDDLVSQITKGKQEIGRLNSQIKQINEANSTPRYVLFSQDKFNSIYTQRQWWMKGNFYGANLEKFNQNYELVYNKNGIFIWKIN